MALARFDEGFTVAPAGQFETGQDMSYDYGSTGEDWETELNERYIAEDVQSFSGDDIGFTPATSDQFQWDATEFSTDWADDSETPADSEDGDSWWETAWDFASSDRMLDFLLGAGAIGLGMLDSKPAVPVRSSRGGGGGGKPPPRTIDLGKLTSKPKVIARR